MMGDKNKENELQALRRKLDQINLMLLDVLNTRGKVVHQIGRVKKEMAYPLTDLKREEEIFKYLAAHNHGPFSNEQIRVIFQEIFEQSKQLQKNLK